MEQVPDIDKKLEGMPKDELLKEVIRLREYIGSMYMAFKAFERREGVHPLIDARLTWIEDSLESQRRNLARLTEKFEGVSRTVSLQSYEIEHLKRSTE